MLISQVVTGEVHVGRGGHITYAYADDPVHFWRYLFLYPSICIFIGLDLRQRTQKVQWREDLLTVLKIAAVTSVGFLISLFY
ncbi:MAG: hypothetical protein L3J47_05105 [Sulfurovum sp.]|nr:hypothetical protein [Sulfurovum sp.]